MSRALKVGLEVHAQLQASRKLFSDTRPGMLHAPPNSHVSFFDATLPGTQPILSLDCLRLALRAGVALNAQIAQKFSFDRKHYMYRDQPLGYQITQHVEPFAKNGYLDLAARDYPQHMQRSATPQRIHISQIQLEQDTGKTIYVDGISRVDLNRANTALIELVTEPEFSTAESCVVFIRKLQHLLRHIGVSAGDMETGAMRVDVNVSVGTLTERCEVKNLFSTSAVYGAIGAEYARQLKCLETGETVHRESRGWDGHKTWRLRGKESALDYRYMPDPDLPEYVLHDATVSHIKSELPELPDKILDALTGPKHAVALVDAKTLMEHDGFVDFYFKAFDEFVKRGGQKSKLVGTWLVHRWIGDSNPEATSASEASSASDVASSAETKLPPLDIFVDILLAVDSQQISSTTGKMLLKHVASAPDATWDINKMIQEYGLGQQSTSTANGVLDEACSSVIERNPDVVERIKKGKKGSVAFLLGQVMKETQGTLNPKDVRSALEKLLSQ